MSAVLDYLHEGSAMDFSYPECDCCTWVADWVIRRTGLDPAADLRGLYATRAGALRVMLSCGGLAAAWGSRMAACGFRPTSTPVAGDVGVVRDGGGREVAALRVEGAWAAKTERGVLLEDLPTVAAWSVPPCQK